MYIFVIQKQTNKERRLNEMKEIKRLIYMALDLLEIIETHRNQPLVNRIKGLLYEVLDELRNIK